jgi:hypothetical protein
VGHFPDALVHLSDVGVLVATGFGGEDQLAVLLVEGLHRLFETLRGPGIVRVLAPASALPRSAPSRSLTEARNTTRQMVTD